MTGILIATHGNFAPGVLQSASMIFGEQPDVAAVSLLPSEGPEDIRRKMEEAVKTFSAPEQVLILVDLWGGTPFNQANGMISGHEGTWAIVAGLNLPLLIEAFASRDVVDTAQGLAAEIAASGTDGIKLYPESLQPAKPEPAAVAAQHKGVLPEGTVVGNGQIEYVLARIDSRLLHGQVATAWTKTTGPNRIIVVSDEVAHNELRKSMIREAAPPGVKANVVPISKMIQVAKDPRFGNTRALLLFETPQEALAAVKGGVAIKELNVGSMAHSEGKIVVNKAISMDTDDIKAFVELKKLGVAFDVRKVPADSRENMDDLLKKAAAGLR